MHILILNGPNLNLLGRREPHIYGTTSFETYLETLERQHPEVTLSYRQSNHEGELIEALHQAGFPAAGPPADGVVLNAGGYTHTSVALADAVAAVPVPVVEVHISHIFAREAFRHQSLLSRHCVGMVSGLGLDGYRLAVLHLIQRNRP